MPSVLDRLSLATPVEVLVSVTLAPGMTALLASCTVPRTTPRPVCAAIGRAIKTSTQKAIRYFDEEAVPFIVASAPSWNEFSLRLSKIAFQSQALPWLIRDLSPGPGYFRISP